MMTLMRIKSNEDDEDCGEDDLAVLAKGTSNPSTAPSDAVAVVGRDGTSSSNSKGQNYSGFVKKKIRNIGLNMERSTFALKLLQAKSSQIRRQLQQGAGIRNHIY